MRRYLIFILCVVLSGFAGNLAAKDTPSADKGSPPAEEDKELVEVIEVLKLMEMLENMEMMKDLHLFAEEENNEKDE